MQSPPSMFRASKSDLRSWFDHGALALDMLLHQKRPLTVGVFANNDPEEINEMVDVCGVDLVQLSGDEPWGACLMANRQVIKALRVRSDETHEAAIARIETGAASAVLLDRATDGAFGGTGQTIDWALAGRINAALPVWLAGGLTPDNVVEAIRTVRPWCVDVSSGVETDGVKDIEKIRAFVRAAKSA
jgi:phosphoribosylanthranilate isomerase